MFTQVPGKIVKKDGIEFVIVNWSVVGSVFDSSFLTNEDKIRKYKDDMEFAYMPYEGNKMYDGSQRLIGNVKDFQDTGKFVEITRIKSTSITETIQEIDKIPLTILFVGIQPPVKYLAIQENSTNEIIQKISKKKKERIEKAISRS